MKMRKLMATMALSTGLLRMEPSMAQTEGQVAKLLFAEQYEATPPGSTVDIPVRMRSTTSNAPAEFSFTLVYNGITSISEVKTGPSVEEYAGKSFMCNDHPKYNTKYEFSMICLAYGGKDIPIPDGDVAVLTVKISPDTKATKTTLSLVNVIIGDSKGNTIGTEGNSIDIPIRQPSKAQK